jgi:hypothetical protein
MHEEVTLLWWPHARAQGAALVARGEPCVWLVPPQVPPPTEWSDLEDWIRLPSDADEIAARTATVAERATHLRHPHVDEPR